MHRINLSQLDNTVGLPNSYSQDTDFISGRYYAIQLWSTFEQQEPSSALFSICIYNMNPFLNCRISVLHRISFRF